MGVRCHVWDRGFSNSGKQFVPMFPLAFVSRPGMTGKVSLEIPTAPSRQLTQQGLPAGNRYVPPHWL